MANTHEQRIALLNSAKEKNIIEVAHNLGMGLIHNGKEYRWEEHDSFVLVENKNYFYWNAMQKGGGPIELVKLINDCSRSEAIAYLNGITTSTVKTITEIEEKPFHYHMKEHSKMDVAINYLVSERKLSPETVNEFIEKGLLAQGTHKDKKTGKTEPVIIFKHYGFDGEIKGVSLHGIWKNHNLHGDRGRLVRTWGDGYYGMTFTVGNPPTASTATKENPIKIIIFEAPIDLMSYYELNKDAIGNAVLVSMNGLRKETISKFVANTLGSEVPEKEKIDVLSELQKSDVLNTDKIKFVLAVDNDDAGRHFVEHTFGKGFGVTEKELPPLLPGKEKSDYNDYLKETKQTKNYQEDKEMGKIYPEEIPNYMESLETTVEKTFQEMEAKENTIHYITSDELEKIMESHLQKIELLVTNYQTSSELVETPTIESGEQLKAGLEETISTVNKETNKTILMAIKEVRTVALTNVKANVNGLRLTMKNGFNRRILALNNKVYNLVKAIETKFSLEPKEEKSSQETVNSEVIEQENKKVSDVFITSEIIRNTQRLILLNEENQKLNSLITDKIKENPLADINSLQEQLKENEASISVTKKEINGLAPTISESKNDEMNTLDNLQLLVAEKERLETERTAVVKEPDFLRKEGLLEKFRNIDAELNKTNEKIKNIEQGTNPDVDQKIEIDDSKELDSFDLVASTAAKKVVETVVEKTNVPVETTNSFTKMMEGKYDSESIKEYLDSAINFHEYTPKNIQLIMEQLPVATQVASASKWQNLGYEIEKDAKPIEILKPVFKEGQEKPSFEPTHVYDVSQTTEGKLKAPLVYDLEQRNSFTAVFDTLKEDSKAELNILPLTDKDSVYNEKTNTIVINEGLGKSGTIQTQLSETINRMIDNKRDPLLQKFEKEAEEYMIGSHIGIEDNTNDFSVIDEMKNAGIPNEEFAKSVKNSTKLSTTLINKMDNKYKNLLDKNKNVNRFEERVEQAKVENKKIESTYNSKEQKTEKSATVRM